MLTLLVAFYFSIMIPDRDYPMLIGPYTEWNECASVREWLDRRGYETDSCLLMPFPQESMQLEVLHLPLED
jgi:hypothetical protein